MKACSSATLADSLRRMSISAKFAWEAGRIPACLQELEAKGIDLSA